VLLDEGIAAIGAEDRVAALDLLDGGIQLALQLVTRCPETAAILLAVMRHRPISQLRSNILWMGKLRLKMKLQQYSI